MSYDVVVFADLKFSPAAAKKWKAAKPTPLSNAPKGFPGPDGKRQSSVTRVIAMLEKSTELVEIKDKAGGTTAWHR